MFIWKLIFNFNPTLNSILPLLSPILPHNLNFPLQLPFYHQKSPNLQSNDKKRNKIIKKFILHRKNLIKFAFYVSACRFLFIFWYKQSYQAHFNVIFLPFWTCWHAWALNKQTNKHVSNMECVHMLWYGWMWSHKVILR